MQGWMAVEYLAGEIKTGLPDTPTLAAMLYHLHRQRRLGWRITLLPLLEQYWQQASPARRTPFGWRSSSGCVKRVNHSRCGLRLCIWMFTPETSSTRPRATD
jgi:hypothetical protein